MSYHVGTYVRTGPEHERTLPRTVEGLTRRHVIPEHLSVVPERNWLIQQTLSVASAANVQGQGHYEVNKRNRLIQKKLSVTGPANIELKCKMKEKKFKDIGKLAQFSLLPQT